MLGNSSSSLFMHTCDSIAASLVAFNVKLEELNVNYLFTTFRIYSYLDMCQVYCPQITNILQRAFFSEKSIPE